MLIGSTLFFAVTMLATPFAGSIPVLMALRFVTGLGLGCIMPNAMALVGEFSPAAHRVKRMMIVSCGFTLGAALGGFISAALIPALGWRSVFFVGGAVPLVLTIAMVARLPESLQFLVLKGRVAQACAWLAHFAPQAGIDANTRLVVRERAATGAPVAELFSHGRLPVTLLWAISFMNLIDLYFLSNWLPTVMRDAGYSPGTAVIVGTVLQTGGVIGTLSLGWFIERYGFVRVLFCCVRGRIGGADRLGRACAAVAAGGGVRGRVLRGRRAAGRECARGPVLPDVAALDGHRLEPRHRPDRLGARPLVGGQLIALNWSNGALFHAAAVPVLCSALFVLGLPV